MNIKQLRELIQTIPDDRIITFYDAESDRYYEPTESTFMGAVGVIIRICPHLKSQERSLDPTVYFVPNPYYGCQVPKQLNPDDLDINNESDRVSYYWQQICNYPAMNFHKNEILKYRWCGGGLEVIVSAKFDKFHLRREFETRILQAQLEGMGMSGGKVLVICEP